MILRTSAGLAGLFLGVVLAACGGSVESGAPEVGRAPAPGETPGGEPQIDDSPPSAPASPGERIDAPPSKSNDRITPVQTEGAPIARADCAALKSAKGRGSFTHAPGDDWFDGIVDVVAYSRGPLTSADGTKTDNAMELRFSSTPPAYAEARASNANDSFWGIWFQRPTAGPLTPGDYLFTGGYGGGSTCTANSGQGGSSTFGNSPAAVLRVTKVDASTIEGTFHHGDGEVTFKAPLVAPHDPHTGPTSGGPWTCCP